METLADALPRQQARVREVLALYEELQRENPRAICGPAIAMIKASLAEAERAAISGDVIAMLRAHEDLKEIQ